MIKNLESIVDEDVDIDMFKKLSTQTKPITVLKIKDVLLPYDEKMSIIDILVDIIRNNKDKLEKLSLIRLRLNELGPGMKKIYDAISECTKLQKLNLNNNMLKESLVDLMTMMENNKTITELSISENGIEGNKKIIQSLCTMIEKNKVLTDISLYGNDIDNNNVGDIIEALKKNDILTELDINLMGCGHSLDERLIL